MGQVVIESRSLWGLAEDGISAGLLGMAAVEAFPSIDQGTDCTWMKKSQIPEIYWQ